MGYKSKIFKNGETLHDTDLNNIISGIDAIFDEIGYSVADIITPVNFTTSNGYYTSEHHSLGYGKYQSGTTFGYTSVFSVKAGQTVVMYANFNSNISGLLEVDAGGVPVGTQALITGETGDYISKTWRYTADRDMYCRACNRVSALSIDEWVIEISEKNPEAEKVLKPLEETVQKMINGTGNTVSYRPNEPRKAVICFTFDDGFATDSDAYAIFKERNMVCSFALIGGKSTGFDRYLQYQDEGFEILSHSTDGTEMSDGDADAATIENKMKKSKENLEAAGFNITAWVTPSSYMHENFVPALRKYYDLGFTVYRGNWTAESGTKPYNAFLDDLHGLWRVSWESAKVDTIKNAIDLTVENTGYLNLYAHQLTDAKKDKLAEILDYIQEYIDEGLCIVTTVTEGYVHYYTLRHSDLIGVLNKV